MFGLTIKQAEQTALWEYELYYEAHYQTQIKNTKDSVELAFIQNLARATDGKAKYIYNSIDKIYEAVGVKKSEERLKRAFYPDEYYEENKTNIDEMEERRIAQQRFNEARKNRQK
ncbi:hypothetical protein pwc_48 [Weissella phage PWc]|nr:hypothetical protein pwc_48 [Weissella phage PWc]